MNKTTDAIRIGNIYGDNFGTGYAGNVWDVGGVSPALMTAQGGNRQPMIIVKTNNKKGYDIAMEGDYINMEQPGSLTRRGRVGHGVSQTIDTSSSAHCVVMEDNKLLRIRKLTPSECFKLMGFDYADADKLSAAGISNAQLYKMAGNSIVVDVLEAIFKEVYNEEHE